MAVITSGVYTSDKEISHVGCVFNVREQNGYNDSDFYADVWDEETQSVKSIMYDTTRCGGWGNAEIDITIENLRKVYSYYRKSTIAYLNLRNEEIAKTPQKDKSVVVIRGRKVPKGTKGIVFWIGSQVNPYSGVTEVKAGIKTEDGQKYFLLVDYLEVENWEQYVVHGKERKEVIRRSLLNNIPYFLRDYLNPTRSLKNA